MNSILFLKQLRLFLGIFAILFSSPVLSQETRDSTSIDSSTIHCDQPNTPSKLQHGVGFHAGLSTGFGFSYRYWPDNNGFQVTLFPLLYGKNDDREFLYSAGLQYLRKLREFQSTTISLYTGAHITNFYINKSFLVTGLGFGVDHDFNTLSTVSFKLGYSAYNILENISTLPTAEVSALYKF